MKKENKKVTYKEFLEMVENDEFKISEVDYNQLIKKKDYDAAFNNYHKKKADSYNVPAVFNLFENMCRYNKRIITLPEYLDVYMQQVSSHMSYSFVRNLGVEDCLVYKNIMKLRGYSAYVSALAEVSFKLICQEILSEDTYRIHMNEDTDQILGVDVVIEHTQRDEASYVHITKASSFAMDKLDRKSRKTVEVFNYETQEVENRERDFENHVLALYDDSGETCDKVNGIYIFKRDYVRGLLKDNQGLCDKKQLKELENLDLLKNVEWE